MAREAARSWLPVFAGDAWVGGQETSVRCEQSGGLLRVACAGARAFVIAPDGERIEAEAGIESGLSELETEILIGPALLLALARRGVYALHAAAVTAGGGVVALVGESGAGKSTLAKPAGPVWKRVADDILPFSLVRGAPVALPHYPQLKLPAEAQYPRDAASPLGLAGVCEIGPPSQDGQVYVEELSPQAGALCLISHTVAARLFPEDLLSEHLEVCASMAAGMKVARLRCPRTLEALPSARQAVTDRFSATGR